MQFNFFSVFAMITNIEVDNTTVKQSAFADKGKFYLHKHPNSQWGSAFTYYLGNELGNTVQKAKLNHAMIKIVKLIFLRLNEITRSSSFRIK